MLWAGIASMYLYRLSTFRSKVGALIIPTRFDLCSFVRAEPSIGIRTCTEFDKVRNDGLRRWNCIVAVSTCNICKGRNGDRGAEPKRREERGKREKEKGSRDNELATGRSSLGLSLSIVFVDRVAPNEWKYGRYTIYTYTRLFMRRRMENRLANYLAFQRFR